MTYNVRPTVVARESHSALDTVLAVMRKEPVALNAETRRVLRCLTKHRKKDAYIRRCEIPFFLESSEISAGELARRLGISRQQILRYLEKGKNQYDFIPIRRELFASVI